MWLKFIYIGALLQFAECAKILVCVPLPSRSHHVVFKELWKKLHERGHHLTVITTDPLHDPKLANMTEIDVSEVYIFFKNVSKLLETELNPWNYNFMERIGQDRIRYYLVSHPGVKKIIQGKDKFDVVFIHHLLIDFVVFARIYKCPTILISTTDTDQIRHGAIGNPMHPVLHPDLHLPYYGPMDFSERLLSTIYYLYVWYNHNFINAPFYEGFIRDNFNVSIKMEELLKSIDLVFLNSHPVMHGIRSVSPGTILYSHYRKSWETMSLEKDVKDFMDKSKRGFIYFSLGSNVKSKELSQKLQETIKEVLRELPYDILYKYEADSMPEKPTNVKIIKWAPQGHILNHPNIRLFITQGGRQSTEEAIYASVPMVVIPFFYDQLQNANMMKARGVAQVVHRQPYLKKEELKNAIEEVITNPKYKEAVKLLRKLALDVPMNGLDKAVWWTEYVIRNKGAKHLRNPAADLPWYQFLLLDVIGFLVLVLAVTFLLAYMLIKWLIIKFKHPLMENKKRD